MDTSKHTVNNILLSDYRMMQELSKIAVKNDDIISSVRDLIKEYSDEEVPKGKIIDLLAEWIALPETFKKYINSTV